MLLGWRVSGCRVGELPEITAMALLIALYGCVIFLSAFLLFLVQPMAAKQLLPVLGGSAAVWTTCLVFFQTALLAGYFYAWRIVARLRPLAQSLVHIALLTAALLVLGTRIRADAFPAAPYWIEVPDARHTDVVDKGGDELLNRIAAFLDEASTGAVAMPTETPV